MLDELKAKEPHLMKHFCAPNCSVADIIAQLYDACAAIMAYFI